jgi:hypothetical protein
MPRSSAIVCSAAITLFLNEDRSSIDGEQVSCDAAASGAPSTVKPNSATLSPYGKFRPNL